MTLNSPFTQWKRLFPGLFFLLDLKGIFLIVPFLIATCLSFGQTLPPEVTHFPPDRYDGHNQVFAVQELPGGRTAFGTMGIPIYDGEGFRTILIGSGKAVFSMDRDTVGHLYVGGPGIMGVVAPDSSGTLSYHSLVPLLPDSLKDFNIIWSTKCTPSGDVLFASRSSLFLYNKDSIQVLLQDGNVFSVNELSEELIIQNGDSGLFRLENGKLNYINKTQEFIDEGKNFKGIRSILQAVDDTNDRILFTAESGIYRYDHSSDRFIPVSEQEGMGRSEHPFHPEGGWENKGIHEVCRLDPSMNPYGAAYVVGTKHDGVYFLSPQARILYHLGKEEGLPAQLVWSLAPAGNGDLWVGTQNGIALVHTGIPFTSTHEDHEHYEGRVRSLAEDNDEPRSLFVGTTQGTWVKGKEEDAFKKIEGVNGNCWDLMPWPPHENASRSGPEHRAGGQMLIPEMRTGLTWAFATEKKEEWKTELVLQRGVSYVTHFKIPNGRELILSGGRYGLVAVSPEDLFNGKASEKALLDLDQVPEDILSVGVDQPHDHADSIRFWGGMHAKGVLSVTMDTGFTVQKITHYDTTDGLPPGEIYIFEHPLEEGLLFGTRKGLYEFQQGRFRPSCDLGALYCSQKRQVLNLEKGLNGEIWVMDGTGGQVKRLVPDGSEFRMDSLVFRALAIGTVRDVQVQKDRVWLGGESGLAAYFPEVKNSIDVPWHCLVREVRGAGDSLLSDGVYSKPLSKQELKTGQDTLARSSTLEQPASAVPSLPYSENRMEFKYAAAFNDRQKEVRYSYKLSGFDTSWSDWTQETRKEYTSLPEGAYTFKVKAKNVYGKESRFGEYEFIIQPPWYRTWTAFTGYGVSGILLIWGLLWLNSRRLLAQKQRLERIVAERTQEIQEQKVEVEKKNKDLKEANKVISDQKEEVVKQKEEVERQKEIVEAAHTEITDSINYAKRIQEALLGGLENPQKIPYEHFIFFQPQATVSGDFYWATEKKGFVYIAAVDCTGHGVPGAFMSMLGISFLNEIMSGEDTPDPGEVLNRIRERLVSELSGKGQEEEAKDGMDAALIRLPSPGDQNPKTRKVEFAGANNPLYVVKEGIGREIPGINFDGWKNEKEEEIRVKPFKANEHGFEIKGDKMAVGYESHAQEPFTTAELEVPEGAMLYLFSDGFADQFGGPKGKKYRYGAFKKRLTQIHQEALSEQKSILEKEFKEWKGEQEQVDDVVVIGVSVR